MGKIDGKFELVENKNYLEFLIKSGIPEDIAKKLNESRPIVTSKLSGDKLTVKFENTLIGSQTIEYTLNKEIDEVINTVPLKSTATVEGDNLTIKSKTADGRSGTRAYKFTDAGVEVILLSNEAGTANRIYKRI